MPKKKSLKAQVDPHFLFNAISYIASVKAIAAIDGNEVIVGSKRLPLSRERQAEILERLLKH
jgi:hypothetical protein